MPSIHLPEVTTSPYLFAASGFSHEDAQLKALDRQDMLSLYHYLWLTRALEERLETLLKQGHVIGGLYRSLGQEATAVACGYVLAEGDWLAPSIRDLGATLVCGLKAVDVIRQHTARATSLCAGKDNVNHTTVPSLGLLGPISPLGTQLCVLNGVALSFRMAGDPRVCLTFQGDGATRTGASHEGFAMASALNLPIVVVIEHNRWSFGTRSTSEAAVQDWCDVAGAYGIPSLGVDGNDVLEVYDVAAQAVARARAGDGMTIIVADTYRMLGHAQHDAQKYVPSEELEEWRGRDPIARFESYLVDSSFATQEALAAVRSAVAVELDEAVEQALEEPFPVPAEARTRVYADPDLAAGVPWTRRSTVGYEDVGPRSLSRDAESL